MIFLPKNMANFEMFCCYAFHQAQTSDSWRVNSLDDLRGGKILNFKSSLRYIFFFWKKGVFLLLKRTFASQYIHQWVVGLHTLKVFMCTLYNKNVERGLNENWQLYDISRAEKCSFCFIIGCVEKKDYKNCNFLVSSRNHRGLESRKKKFRFEMSHSNIFSIFLFALFFQFEFEPTDVTSLLTY